MRKMFGLENPRVGLLNNGTEACKGTELQQAAYRRLTDSKDVNFVGNIEGSAIPFDNCDVLVTDGFTGNILLKSVEGVGKFMLGKLKGVFYSSLLSKLAAAVIKKPLYSMKKDLDPTEQGGSPILGISKPVIKAHGSSNAKAFKNAIRQAIAFAESGATEEITEAVSAYAARKKAERESLKSQEPTE
jgi:glycerol-3-phosphate acyltransferase PlsX